MALEGNRGSLRPGEKMVTLRVPEAEHEAWKECAGGVRRLSAWMRQTLNAEATGMLHVDPVQRAERKTELKREARALCPRAHTHRPGAWCRFCGEVGS